MVPWHRGHAAAAASCILPPLPAPITPPALRPRGHVLLPPPDQALVSRGRGRGGGCLRKGRRTSSTLARGLDSGRGASSPRLHRLLGTDAAEGPQRLRPPRRRQVRSPSTSSSPVTGVLPFGLLLAGGRCSPLRLQLAAGLGRTRRPGGGEEGEGWWGPQGQICLFTAQLTVAGWKMQRSVM